MVRVPRCCGKDAVGHGRQLCQITESASAAHAAGNVEHRPAVDFLVSATTSSTEPVAVELGLDTFGDVTVDADGRRLTDAQVIRNVVEEAVLADRLGLDFFGVGEHHRDDFAVSSPETVLAAIAARTERIRLGSAVTVLSSDDPVRVFQRFATLDAVSNGRAEVILGRGSFTESFPLFGYQLEQLRGAVRGEARPVRRSCSREEPVTWSRHHPGAAARTSRCTRAPSGGLTTVGRRRRQPRVGRPRRPYGLPLMLAIIGGEPARFAPVRRPLPPGARPVRAPRRCRSASTPPATSPTPTSRRSTSCGRTGSRCATASAPSAAGRRRPAPSSSRRPARRRALRRVARDRRPQDRRHRATCSAPSRFDMKYSAGTLPHEHDDAQHRAVRHRGRSPRVRELLASQTVATS